MTESYFLNVMITILLALGVCCIITIHLEAIRTIFQSFCAIFYVPLERIYNYLRSVAQRVRAWIAGQLKTECTEPNETPVYFIIGAIVYSLLTVIFLYCDWGMLVLTLGGWGMDLPKFQLYETSTMTAAAIISVSVFWGAMFADAAGWTHLTPYIRNSNISTKRFLKWLSVTIFVFCIAICSSMAIWRQDSLMKNMSPLNVSEATAAQENLITVDNALTSGKATADSNLKDDTARTSTNGNANEDRDLMERISNAIFMYIPAVIAALCSISGGFSFVNCCYLLKYILVLAITMGAALITLPFIFLCWMLITMLNGIFGFLRAILDFLASLGASFMRLFGWRPEYGIANQPILASAGNAAAPHPATPAPDNGINDPRSDQAGNNDTHAAEQLPGETNNRPTNTASNNDVGFNPFSRRS